MPNFDRKSNYDKDSGIVEVQIGMEKPVLEVELNELQEIARERVRKVVNSAISDGAFSDTGISYSDGKVKVVDTTFIIDGELIFVDNLELPASNNDEVFIKVWDKQVTGEDILKKYGNEQGEVIANKIIDERVGEETSRRIVLAYDLVKSLEQNEKGLKLGKIVNGNLVLETKIILPLNEVKDLLAGKVDNNRVLTDVPENAKFTDTTYSEISTSEIDAGTSSTLRTVSGRRIKYVLDKVQGWINALTKADVGLGNVLNYGVATQAEAQAGTSNAKYMTPIRTKEAIQALQAVSSVNSKTGAVTLSKSDVGLGNVDNVKQASKTEFDAHKAAYIVVHGVARGTSTFAGQGNERAIAHGLGATPEAAYATPTVDPQGRLGEVWIRMTSTHLYVGNSGSFTGGMSWVAIL